MQIGSRRDRDMSSDEAGLQLWSDEFQMRPKRLSCGSQSVFLMQNVRRWHQLRATWTPLAKGLAVSLLSTFSEI